MTRKTLATCAVACLGFAVLVGAPAPTRADPGAVAPVTSSVPVPPVARLLGGKFELHFTPERNGPLAAALVALVSKAKKSVDVAMFDVDEPAFVSALLESHRRGVKVRVVMDAENRNPAVAALTSAGIVRFDTRKSAFMHAKLVVVDGERVFGGSLNATTLALGREDNNAFFVTSAALAARITPFLDDLDAGRFGPGRARRASPVVPLGPDATIEVLFAPEDPVLPRVLQEIKAARTSIRFMAFALSHPEIVKALVDARARGVSVEGVVDGSLWLEGNGPTLLAAGGCRVRLDGNPSLLHHKVVLIDGQVVLSGSFNFSQKAVTKNDEDLFVIRSKAVAAAYAAELAHVLSIAKPLPPRPAPTPGLTGSLPPH